MKKIGLFGGTFNPIHIAHLVLAQSACDQLKLDKVIFIPSNISVHKNNRHIISAEDRLKMVQLATKGNSKFFVSNIEIKRSGLSYSIDTVEYYKKRYPSQTKFYFIIGEDTHCSLHRWKCIDDLLKKVNFVSASRLTKGNESPKIKVRHISMPVMNVSSSDIRQRVKKGTSIQYFVPTKVKEYIQKNNLYLIDR